MDWTPLGDILKLILTLLVVGAVVTVVVVACIAFKVGQLAH